MARQDIKVRILGENKTGAAFKKFRGDVDSTKSAIASLRNQIIAAFGVREIIRAGDTFVNVQNRMMALSGSAEKTAGAMAHMKRIANESRSDFDAIGTLFTRLTIATQELGVSQNDIAKATQTVANTFVIAGAESSEAANSARQLAQGLASGALRGDELRSVMENNVILSNLLADGLGITIGQLRDFGKEGKLTAQAILPILINSVDETTKTVQNMDLTIGQSMTLLRTNFTTLIGEFENATGVFGKSANAVGILANNLEVLGGIVTVLAFTAIPKLISMLNGLRIAMLANPVTAFAVGLTAVVSAIQIATKETKTLDEQIADLDKTIQDAQATGMIEPVDGVQTKLTEEYLALLIANRDALIQLKEESDAGGESFSNFNQNLTDFKQHVGESIQVVKTFAETVQGQLTNAFQKFFDFTSKQFLDFQNLATGVARAVLNELINVFIVQKLVGMISNSLTDFGDFLKDDGSTAKAAQLTSSLFNGDGGGYTGMGARAGGIDGKGGFPAILHPNETVIDHTKGQGMGTTVNFNISTVDAAGFDQLLASRKGLITSIINNAMNNQGKMGVV
nr:tail length tape measure protein [uncultured Mediterranean phage uvMED]BAR29321.1 tail length tape measure protein [uncultured Mediterranean phage uvMED]BAR29409.1 tail length tape measure protein [uncultured Mediterranean phage uvMED]